MQPQLQLMLGCRLGSVLAAYTMSKTHPQGSGVDVVTRALTAQPLTKRDQPVAVENRGGASLAIGAEFDVNVSADSYTLTDAVNSTFTSDCAEKNVTDRAPGLTIDGPDDLWRSMWHAANMTGEIANSTGFITDSGNS